MPMIKLLNRLTWTVVAVAVLAGISYWTYSYTENERRIRKLEEEKQRLQQIVDRITSHKRIAEMMLTGRRVDQGVPKMDLVFAEYARDEKTLANIRHFTVSGTNVHIDAQVIQFDRAFVSEGDALRGVSVALFTRVYGDKTAPEKGEPIDPTGGIPAVYKGADPGAAEFEAKLWSDFWRLLEDPQYAKERGVRIAQGEGVWWPPKEGKLYTLSIAAAGGIELKSEQVKGIYQEAMRTLAPAPDTQPAR